MRRLLLGLRIGPAALVMAALLFTIFGSETAGAALHSPIAADASGDPTDTFTSSDALFAYVLSDLKGGRICVVPGDVTDPAAASCDDPAWGPRSADEQTVLSIGTTFVPVVAPPLEPGTWRLLVQDAEGNADPHELSQPFTVTPCVDCSTTIADEALQPFKDAAKANGLGASIACVGFAVKDVLGAASGVKGALTALSSDAKSYGGGSNGGFDGAINDAGEVAGIILDDGLTDPGEEEALEILQDLTCSLSLMYHQIEADPPDPNYTVIAQPTFSTIPDVGDADADALAAAADKARAYGVAELTAYERFVGAENADAQNWMQAQASAIATMGQDGDNALADVVSALRAYATDLDANPDFAAAVASQERINLLASTYGRIRTNGFDAGELSVLQNAGLTDNQIDAVRSHFSPDPGVLPAGQTMQSILRSTADGFESEEDAFDAFARNAAAVAGTLSAVIASNHPPTAVDDNLTVPENAPAAGVFVIGNDSDPDNDPLTVTSWTQGAHGSVECNSGNCYYTPDSGFIGNDSYMYTISDGRGGTASATVRVAVPALAHGLTPFFSDSGLISLSVDAIGYIDPASGPLRVHKNDAGAKVRKAYLFAAGAGSAGYLPVDGDVTLDGTPINWNPAMSIANDIGSGNVMADVTSIVKAKVDAAPAGDVTFTAAEPNGNAVKIDGEILAVTLDDPTVTSPRSVTLLYGAQKTTGDTFHVGLAAPVDKSNSDFALNLSLGISWSYQPAGQFSTVDVNGTRMTSAAGGQDDCIEKYATGPSRPDFFGFCQNGELITAGGIDDTNDDPANPNANDVACSDTGFRLVARCDDELYSLLPFVKNGDTSLTFATANPSNDDNIMFAALDVRGGAAVVGEGLVLSPTTATNTVGQMHTLTASVQDDGGSPMQGLTVHFQVTSGPNSGTTGSGVTGADGKAQFSYTSTKTGTDYIVASFTDPQTGLHTSNEVTKTWTAPASPSTTLTVNPGTGDFADPATVSAVLKNTATSAAISGKSVTFKLNGSESCTATTDATGKASCHLTPAEAAGTYPLGASFAGDTGYQSSTGSASFMVTLEETSVAYTGPVSAVNGQPLTLSGTLATDDLSTGTGLGGRTVTFTLGSGSTAQSCHGTTLASGSSSCTISSVSQTPGLVPAVASYTGDTFYKQASASSSVNVFAPPATGAFVIGDLSAGSPTLGKSVNFWGAQWAKNNSLSGGSAPSAMKGFADSPTSVSCGATWTTRPGNSSAPPTTIPNQIYVIVSSKVTQSGSTISGKIVHIVIVQVNPGYGPDPGHAGTGKIIGTIC